jgi:NAD+ diphosphatase
MDTEKVFLFRQSCLVLPETQSDAEAVNGVDRGLADAAFGKPAYDKVSVFEAGDSMQGFLLDAKEPLPPGWKAYSLREAAAALSCEAGSLVCAGISGAAEGSPLADPAGSGTETAGRLFRVYHVLQWRRESAYCGSCGTANIDAPDETARLCPNCGRLEFPRIAPAVIVFVVRDDGRGLLAHNVKFKNGVYSLIAGFNEAGENLESTVVREIREEVGIEVRDVRYVTSQPWPFPNSLMVGFTARYAGGEIKPDGKEIVDARWFTREELLSGEVELPGKGAVSRYIIESWLQGKR